MLAKHGVQHRSATMRDLRSEVCLAGEELDRARQDKNMKRWRDGKMIKRWCAAGMLNAERSFRRLKGYRQMPTFVAALARHVEAIRPACDAARVA